MILALDDNIGQVYITKKKWVTLKEFEDDCTIRIMTAGSFDAADRIGVDVSRFWAMDYIVEVNPLTNKSNEYEVQINIVGFFSREADDTQEETLSNAFIELIDQLTLKDTELTDLNTGSGYMGYLRKPPRMVIPIRDAILDKSGAQGHVGHLQVHFFEEVTK